MNKLLLIDGSNLLFQMYFGMPARITNKDGNPIHGILGFVGALLKIIRMTQPTHIAVLFDGEHHNARKDIDGDYKANRPDFGEEDNPFSQLPDIYSALDYLNIKHTETTDCETDDWIASYALNADADTEIIISSFDSDFFQLVTDRVSVLRYRGDKTAICDTAYIKEKLGIPPALYADYKSLTGDKADNIKGADKIGAKTAAGLVNEFGGIESIIANADKIKKPSIRESVITNTERIRKNYQLIKLQNNVKLPFALAELEYEYNGITTNKVLTAIGVK